MGSEHHGPLPGSGLSSGAYDVPFAAPHVGNVAAQNAFVPASSLRERMSPRTPVPPLQTQSLGSAPSGLPALPGSGFPTSAARGPRVEELLVEQNRLLLSLLQAQQAAAQPQQPSSSAAPAPKPYVDPKKILEEVDPQIRAVFQEFEVETKNLFSAWATHKAMQHKYERLKHDNVLHPHFEAEANTNGSSPSCTLPTRNL